MAAQRESDSSFDVNEEHSARVGRAFIALYAAAYLATSLVFIAPLLVTLALKVNSLVGTDRAAVQPVAGRGDRIAGRTGGEPPLRAAE